MTSQQLERDVYVPPPVAVATCLECGQPCLRTERLCFGCLLMEEDLSVEQE